MGEGLLLHIGECFVSVDEDYAKKHHEKLLARAKDELDKLGDSKSEVEKQMKELRAHLYAKFGSSINLDEESA